MGQSPKILRERKLDPRMLHPFKLQVQDTHNGKAYVKKGKTKHPEGRWYPGAILEGYSI